MNSASDTSFVSGNLNTAANAYSYKIDFYCNGVFKGSTQTASSVFLTAQGLDNKVKLSWQYFTPWTNYNFYIYRESFSGSGIWNLIDSTSQKQYTDTNLINGQLYCYKILAKGKYSDTTILSPLLNWSEEVCATPVDTVPPCQPLLLVEGNCINSNVRLTWYNPNNYCSDDAVMYKIYFQAPMLNNFTLIDSVTSMTDTIFVFDGSNSIAGCFAVSAVDSFGNESPLVNKFCSDNCPEYELPNIITLNNDGTNDIFIPIKNKYIESIDLKIYDRWGILVFETNVPEINWDGKNMNTKQFCTNGTYFYTCTVNEIRLAGIKSRFLKGWIQIIDK